VIEIKLGTRVVTSPSADNLRIAMLLWGSAGCGKTTLAATAPGTKLWINFDPDGMLSLIDRDDVLSLDLSGETHTITERMRDDNPFQIEQTLKEHAHIETVVLDSLTSFSLLATDNAVAKNARPGKNQISLEAPGQVGYTHRNALTLRAFIALLRLTKRMNRHFIAVSHEGTPLTDDEGRTLSIPPALSDSLRSQIGLSVNECWHMEHTDKGERRIQVRPARLFKPMKSRMWDTTKSPEFVWKYDANTQAGEGISEWFTKWQQNSGRRMPMPT
jgi:hypothetical protein